MEEIRNLLRAHQAIAAAIQQMASSGSKVAAAVIPLLGQADITVCAIYNKCEASLLKLEEASSARKAARETRTYSPPMEIPAAPGADQAQE